MATPRRLRCSTACASDPTPIGVTTRAAMSPPSYSSTSVEHRVIRQGRIPVLFPMRNRPRTRGRCASTLPDRRLPLGEAVPSTNGNTIAVRRTRDVRVTARPRLFHPPSQVTRGRRRTAYCSIASRARTGRRHNTAGASPKGSAAAGATAARRAKRADEIRPCAGVVISWTGALQLARGSSREDQQLVGGEPR